MASGSDSEPYSPLSSIASSSLTEDHPPLFAPNKQAPKASSFVGADGDDDYANSDIQIMFDIVQRAQGFLPRNEVPTSALFQAYHEILPERGIDTTNEHHLSKLVFKIGGCRTGGNLLDKFRAVMTKMNITLELDNVTAGQDSDPSPIYSDDYLGYGAEDESTGTASVPFRQHHGIDEKGPSSDSGTLHRPLNQRSNNEGFPRSRVIPIHAPRESLSDDDDITDPISAIHERSAIGFEKHRVRFSALEDFREWHAKSSDMRNIVESLDAAREGDLLEYVPQVFSEWYAGNVKIWQMETNARRAQDILVKRDAIASLDVWWFAANFDSKRMSRIACRTHEIYATKNALARWRHAAKEQRQMAPRPSLEGAIESEHDPRMIRLATRAHNNLMKSRVFAQWSNRASEEVKKADVASKAHEMGLKSRALGGRPRLEILADALRKRRREQGIDFAEAHPDVQLELDDLVDVPWEEVRPPGQDPIKVLVTPSTEIKRKGSEQGKSSEFVVVDVDDDSSETPASPQLHSKEIQLDLTKIPRIWSPDTLDDERTLLARRHILRMRFFRAWLNYTANYTTNVTGFTLSKALAGWREQCAQLEDKVILFSKQSQTIRAVDVLRSWIDKPSLTGQLEIMADEADYRTRLTNILKKWMASAREGRRLDHQQALAFERWFNHPDRDAALEICAEGFYVAQRLTSTISSWRTAVEVTRAKHQQFEQYGQGANYYHSTTVTLRAWKARAREASINVARESEALEVWRTRCHEEEAPQHLKEWAEKSFFYNRVMVVLPMWREAARERTERHQQLASYGARADFYYKTRDTLFAWKTLTKQKRKQRLAEAHLETRRRIKKGMGARCIAKWREKLEASSIRYEEMNIALEEVTADRDWESMSQAFDTWRVVALEKERLSSMGNALLGQRTLDSWRQQHADHRELKADAEDNWQTGATFKAVKGWSLGLLQRESRRHTVASVLEKKDRTLLRQGFEGWYGRTADKLVPKQLLDGSYQSVDNILQDAQYHVAQTQAKGLLSRWRKSANRLVAQQPVGLNEDFPSVPTPGRPRLLLGSLGRPQTTTPLAPIPNRQQPWQRDSILGSFAMGARGSRSNRSRRNLRVSWAE